MIQASAPRSTSFLAPAAQVVIFTLFITSG